MSAQFTLLIFCTNIHGTDLFFIFTETVHGGWTTWPNWTTCPVSCGKEAALLSRSRTCSDPEPEWGGEYCVGESSDEQYCNNFHCPSRCNILIVYLGFKSSFCNYDKTSLRSMYLIT